MSRILLSQFCLISWNCSFNPNAYVPDFELLRIAVNDLLPEGVDEGLGVQEQRTVRQGHVSLQKIKQIKMGKRTRKKCAKETLGREKETVADLKVLTNEKRGGLTTVLFDRSPFKLFTLKFSNKSIQPSSCERPKTAQRTLFLLFESNS
jgi:hypothetical protein